MPSLPTKIIVTPEGRENIYVVADRESLKEYIKGLGLEKIHNFVQTGNIFLGADHSIDSVLSDVDKADRLAVFTDPLTNMKHSLALVINNKLECFDVGEITKENLSVQ